MTAVAQAAAQTAPSRGGEAGMAAPAVVAMTSGKAAATKMALATQTAEQAAGQVAAQVAAQEGPVSVARRRGDAGGGG